MGVFGLVRSCRPFLQSFHVSVVSFGAHEAALASRVARTHVDRPPPKAPGACGWPMTPRKPSGSGSHAPILMLGIGPGLAACALWALPAWRLCSPYPLAQARSTNKPGRQRYYIFKAAQAEAQSALWVDPRGYYFLNIIVVPPDAQGKGVGKLLVRTVTDQADREKMPCYLESSKDKPNMTIYESWNFRFAKCMDCDDDGSICKLFCMIREPKVPNFCC